MFRFLLYPSPPPFPRARLRPRRSLLGRRQVLVDRETQHPLVYVSYKHPRMRISTPEDFLDHLTLSIFEVAINNRCAPLSLLPRPLAPHFPCPGLCPLLATPARVNLLPGPGPPWRWGRSPDLLPSPTYLHPRL